MLRRRVAVNAPAHDPRGSRHQRPGGRSHLPTGPNAQIFQAIVADKIRPHVTNAMVEEYDRVFEYERLQYLDKRRVANVRRLLKAAAVKVKSRGRLNVSEHEEDNRIYECAVAAKAHYIVTGNTKHFKTPHKFTKIVNARQLLRLLAGDQPTDRTTHLLFDEP